MTNELYIKLQERLDELKNRGILAYVGEDWGQLDLFDRRPPVTWPCALFDVTSADYSDAGKGRQDGSGQVTIRIAHYNPVLVSSGAPDNDRAFGMIDIVGEVYKCLQGLSGDSFTRLSRTKLVKAQRDDGIREFQMSFAYSFVDVTNAKPQNFVHADILITKKEA